MFQRERETERTTVDTVQLLLQEMQLCVGKEMNNLHVPVGRMSGNLPPPGGCLVKMLQLSVVLYDVVMYDDT